MLRIYEDLQKVNDGLLEVNRLLMELKTEVVIAESRKDKLIAKHNELIALAEETENAKPQTIYAGTEDNVDFFKTILATLGLDIEYQVKIVDGEYEIEIEGGRK